MNFSNYNDKSLSLVRSRFVKYKQTATGFDNSQNTHLSAEAALEMKYKT